MPEDAPRPAQAAIRTSWFSAHTHGGGEEFLVLEGVFQDEHGDYPAGSYVRNPPSCWPDPTKWMPKPLPSRAAVWRAQQPSAAWCRVGRLSPLRRHPREPCTVRQPGLLEGPLVGLTSVSANGSLRVQIGQYLKTGTELAALASLPRVYVTANFKETQLTRMRPAEVSVCAYPDHPLVGKVESLAPGSSAEFSLLPPDNATGNFTKIVQRVPLRIRRPRTGPLARLLRPGLSVTVTVDTRHKGEAVHTDGIVALRPGKPASAW